MDELSNLVESVVVMLTPRDNDVYHFSRVMMSDKNFDEIFCNKFLEIIADLSKDTSRWVTAESGEIAYRARIGYDEFTDDSGMPILVPYTGKKIMAPPKYITPAGRFNRENNPFLYGAFSKEIAMAEVQPLRSQLVSLGGLELAKSVKLLNLLPSYNTKSIFERLGANPSDPQLAWDTLAGFIAEEVSYSTREHHYKCCQFIADTFKNAGFDGIIYQSSFWSPKWEDDAEKQVPADKANIVLFDTKSMKFINSQLLSLTWLKPELNPY